MAELQKIENLLELLDNFTSGDALTNKRFKEAWSRAVNLIKENDKQNKETLRKLAELLNEKLGSIESSNASDRAFFTKEMVKLERQYNKDVLAIEKLAKITLRQFERLIPEAYDDEELRNQINQLQTTLNTLEIPEKYDDTEIKEMIEELFEEYQKRLTELGTVVGGIKNAPASPNPVNWTRHQSISLSSGTTVYSLDEAPGHGGKAAIVRYEGQVLTETTHYSINGTDVTLTFDPNDGTKLDATYWIS